MILNMNVAKGELIQIGEKEMMCVIVGEMNVLVIMLIISGGVILYCI